MRYVPDSSPLPQTRWVLTDAYRRMAADPTHSLMWHYLAALREWPT